jgi:hypothetical protein
MRKAVCMSIATAAVAAGTAFGQTIVYPTLPHAANNFIPFGGGTAAGTPTMHQVFDASLFQGLGGGLPIEISSVGFAPGNNGRVDLGEVVIRFGYTNAIPGQTTAAGGLDIPTEGGGGTPNAIGAMTTFYANPATGFDILNADPNNFSEMVFAGTPFVYDPSQGNLLFEIVVPDPANTTVTVSRSGGGPEASRAYNGMRFAATASATTATRMEFTYTVIPTPGAAGLFALAGVAALRRRR